MKEGLKEIVGKTVTAVAVAENEARAPHNQVFLVFSDGTYFEFYGDHISWCADVDAGDLTRACHYAEKCGSKIRAIYPTGAHIISNRD